MQQPQLFLIPFAGGNIYSFNFLMPYLKGFDVVPLELPGRGQRVMEQLLTEFDQAATDIYQQILSKQKSSFFMIYGHSLGTGLGLRVANMLLRINRAPNYLIFSGNPGPRIKKSTQWYLLERIPFIEKVKELGGLPQELSVNNEFIDFIEPVLRADFELAERNTLINESVVSIPIYALMGDIEKNTPYISNWERFTNAEFHFEILSGNHFFIHKHPNRIGNILHQCYKNVHTIQRKK